MREAFPHVVLCFIPPRSTSYLQPCDVAIFQSFKSCIRTQATSTLARSVLDGTFDDVVMNKAWRRQSSTEWASRAVTDLCNENKACATGWRPLRAHSDDDCRRACCKGQRAARHWRLVRETESEPSPLPKTPWTGPLAEASDRRRAQARRTT